MAQEQNYRVKYLIDVEATEGTKQVQAFADSIGNLYKANGNFKNVVGNIKGIMDDLEKTFRPKGRKRDYTFHFDIKTNESEAKLQRIAGLLTSISVMAKDIRVNINPGVPLQTNTIKAQTKKLVDKTALEALKKENSETAAGTIKRMYAAQKKITQAIGKVNAAMAHFEKGRELNIKTDVAKKRLEEIVSLLENIRFQSRMINFGSSGKSSQQGNNYLVPFALGYRAPFYGGVNGFDPNEHYKQKGIFLHSQRIAGRYERLHTNEELLKQKASFVESQRLANFEIWKKKQEIEDRKRGKQEETRNNKKRIKEEQEAWDGKRRSAINRLQYSNPFSFKNMPFAYMFNAYTGLSMMKSELGKAIEYGNIMESARSILKISDHDLTSFETRFTNMARKVREIGVETKFSAIEIAGAVKFLSMAGMDIKTINASIRPITNLALISDADVATIADFSTNIMAGYDIDSKSMPIVADVLSSTVSRSNVNILEMAESYKMAAGYLRMAGVDFSESAAAIGILGNMGIKATMAGTALRAMSTRFAKPTKEARETMKRLDMKFTEFVETPSGNKIEKVRSLSDIFSELKKKGASMEDMQTLFGKIGGNAAMMFLENAEKLKELAALNRVSFGLAEELAEVKQNTTKGLWAQVTSQFSESFMKGFEVMEPQIKRALKGFLDKFSSPEFAKGLAAVGSALLDIFSTLANIGSWFAKNFSKLEPLIFTYVVSTQLYKLAGGLTSVGVALGFIGKQAAASSVLNAVAGTAATGKVVAGTGLVGRTVKTATATLLSSQVASGGGLVGATASLGALGTGAIAATAAITALIGALGWVAYKIWKVKEAKEAVIEELDSNKKYRFQSIEDLHESLHKTYRQALLTKDAVDEVTEKRTISEASGGDFGMFSENGLKAYSSMVGNGMAAQYGYISGDTYTYNDAHRDNSINAIVRISDQYGQKNLNAAIAELTKYTEPYEVDAFIQSVPEKYGYSWTDVDEKLYIKTKDGKTKFVGDFEELPEDKILETHTNMLYQNSIIVPAVIKNAEAFRSAITDFEGAKKLLEAPKDFGSDGFRFDNFARYGFFQNEKGDWVQEKLKENATEKEQADHFKNFSDLHNLLSTLAGSLRKTWGSPEAVETVFKKAGIKPYLYANDPKSNYHGYDANRVTNDPDDGLAGGDYAGTGKLSSAAPKQVNVKITNLLSLEAINLMKSQNGNQPEIQDLKDQLAQALIDVVHDFDASWNT